VLAGLVAVAISAFGVRVFSQAGQFTTIKNMRIGVCQAYGGILAPEDIVIDRETGTAFISSLERKSAAGRSGRRGTIEMIDLAGYKTGSAINFTDVTPALPKRFHPLGLSLFTGNDGTKRLFVVNQAGDGTHSVEIFRIAGKSLEHERSVDLGRQVVFANDVAAVGPESFYVTDSAGPGAVSQALNFSLQRNRSKVFYFDGKKISPVADDFVMANGIAASKGGEEVYVLDTFARSLRFFKRNVATGGLSDSGVLFIGTGVDNIDVGDDGSFWIAAHPRLIDFAMYAAGLKSISASQVIHAVPGKKLGGEVRTQYLDLGKEISGASVAVAYANNFIIGSARDNKLVICVRN